MNIFEQSGTQLDPYLASAVVAAIRSGASALSSLESARAEAQRKQRYLIAFVTPELPDEAGAIHRAILVSLEEKGACFLSTQVYFESYLGSRCVFDDATSTVYSVL